MNLNDQYLYLIKYFYFLVLKFHACIHLFPFELTEYFEDDLVNLCCFPICKLYCLLALVILCSHQPFLSLYLSTYHFLPPDHLNFFLNQQFVIHIFNYLLDSEIKDYLTGLDCLRLVLSFYLSFRKLLDFFLYYNSIIDFILIFPFLFIRIGIQLFAAC